MSLTRNEMLHALASTASQESAASTELRERQARLGTSAELPKDYAEACALAHFINNRCTAERLVTELFGIGGGGLPPDPKAGE